MANPRLTSPPVAGASILFCPICGLEVHRTLPDDPTWELAFWDNCEQECAGHLAEFHPRRYRLWRRLQWAWLLRGFRAR